MYDDPREPSELTTPPMNLLHVIPYFAPAWAYGGVVRATTELTRALTDAGHRVVVVTTDTLSPSERIDTEEEIIDGVRVVRLRNWSNLLRGKLNLSSPRMFTATIRDLMAEHQIEVVHSHEMRTTENLRLAALTKELGVPLVLSPHGTLPYETGRQTVKQLWDRAFGTRLLPHFAQVIALTGAEADEARAVWSACGVPLPDERISIVPNGIHLDDFAALPPADPFRAQWGLGEGPVVLFLGRLQERKGVQFLIPAFAQAVETAPDAKLLIVGPDEGMLATAQAQVEEYELGDRVVFTGLLTGQDRLAALAAADLFAMPAVGEGFSMAVLEAMACGLPALLTPGCNFPEAAAEGAGIVAPREVPALADALTTLLTDSDQRASMGRCAQALIRERYTWAQVAAQMDAVYRRVAARKR
jgi:glycosyltransferase involved in cell wall biosynthesis